MGEPTSADARGVDVAVVGSIHLDLTVDVPTLPRPGETVLGLGHLRGDGGKGANQAVAARRLGARVAMVGQVGDDPDGRALRGALADEGIDVAHVTVHPSLPSGLAVVTVDRHAENAIVVSPGASGALDAVAVRSAAALLGPAKVVLLQLEVTLEAVDAAAAMAGGTVVLNPAPARDLPRSLLKQVDVLVPNRVELARITRSDRPIATADDAAAAARSLPASCAVVVTLGSDGAVVVDGQVAHHVPAPQVRAVDTTAAGDTLCGALAVRLAAGDAIVDAVRWAVRAAALSTTRPGAQASIPTLAELADLDA